MLLDWLGGEDAETAADLLVGAGLAGAVPTVATGYADWADTEPASDTVRRIGIVHAACNATATALFAASLAARAARRARARQAARAGRARLGRRRRLPRRPPHLRRGRRRRHMATFEEYPQDWTQALADAALGEGEMRAVDVDGVAIVIARSGGEVYALSDTLRAPRRLAGRRRARRGVRALPAARLASSGSRTARSSRARPPTRSRRSRRASATARSRSGRRSALAGYAPARFTGQATRESHGRDQDGRRARRRADGARHRPGRRAGGLRRRAARGRRRAPRQGRRARSRSSSAARSRRASSSRPTPTPCAAASPRPPTTASSPTATS